MPTQGAVRWNIKVSKDADLSLRSFFATQRMKQSDHARFIEQAVLQSVFRHTIEDIHDRNREEDPQQIEDEVEAAIREVRAERNSLRQQSA